MRDDCVCAQLCSHFISDAVCRPIRVELLSEALQQAYLAIHANDDQLVSATYSAPSSSAGAAAASSAAVAAPSPYTFSAVCSNSSASPNDAANMIAASRTA